MKLTIAICTFNRGDRLRRLVTALRAQQSSLAIDILFVNNNSTDDTLSVLDAMAADSGFPLHYVTERRQGISHARNRAIEETLVRGSDYMLVMDDDELPLPGWVDAAVAAFHECDADCVGGRVKVVFDETPRPAWLGDDLLGFLAEADHGEEPFWISTTTTPVWTANVAYNMRVFRENPDLRFDSRYNREGKGVGGGEDVIMFESLLERGLRLRYEPRMIVEHRVESWRLSRPYFLKLHYVSGLRQGRWELGAYQRSLFGIAPFMLLNSARHGVEAMRRWLAHDPSALRQTMNFTHSIGLMHGRLQRWRAERR